MKKHPQTPFIKKASGDVVPYDEEKLIKSLIRAGASEENIRQIVIDIEKHLYPGISTKAIYKEAFRMLKKKARPAAARYKLKNAIMEMGPSGFPFEKLVGEIFKAQGYKTKVGITIKGFCINHEIDVIAEKENEHLLVECKYHNLHGILCDVKIPLYIHARFTDVEKELRQHPHNNLKTFQGWVFTNTRFSSDAVQFGKCIGLNLVGWDYPSGNSLNNLVDRLALYPLTCLTTITQAEKQKLIDNEYVMAEELLQDINALKRIGIKEPRVTEVLKEIENLPR